MVNVEKNTFYRRQLIGNSVKYSLDSKIIQQVKILQYFLKVG